MFAFVDSIPIDDAEGTPNVVTAEQNARASFKGLEGLPWSWVKNAISGKILTGDWYFGKVRGDCRRRQGRSAGQ